MALPTTRVYLRSPYYVNLTRANLEKIVIDLYVYTGTLTTDKPADYQYRLYCTAFDGYAEIDISEFARDYIEVNFDGSYTTNSVWLEWDLYYADDGDTTITLEGSYTATGLNGFGYFEDGYNPTPATWLQMSSDYVLVPEKTRLRIPVLQDYLTGYQFARGGFLINNVTGLTTTENTANVFRYVDTLNYETQQPDRIILKYSNRADEVVRIKYFCPREENQVKVTFINKYGALQDLWFYGASKTSMQTSKDTYKRNILSGGTYDTDRHQMKIISKNGVSSMNAISNFYPEDSNATFMELLLSEWVWASIKNTDLNQNKFLEKTEITFPVNVKNDSLQFKTRANDGLISYTFDFEFASDRINSVR
jgi:hypothetical protein